MKFSCIIVDEDDAIRSEFEHYISMLPNITLTGSFHNIEHAKEYLLNNNTDVLFTDVKTQWFVGVHQDNFKAPPPMLVFTTDEPANAHIGFELDAVDCLLKPLAFERFLKTIDKIERRMAAERQREALAGSNADYCFVKTDHNFIKVEFQKILYIEGLENYVRICCENKTVLALNTMKNMEAALAQYNFLRIHRSYLVNLDKVDSVLNYNFYVGDKVLPIGKSYRKIVTDTLKHSYAIHTAIAI